MIDTLKSDSTFVPTLYISILALEIFAKYEVFTCLKGF